VSASGNEAVLAILGLHGFLGVLLGGPNSPHKSTAITIQSSTLFRIERRAMLSALHGQRELSETFMASLLAVTSIWKKIFAISFSTTVKNG
jgi:CRP-like cAMP-binding protein